jgi:hypothetical protein
MKSDTYTLLYNLFSLLNTMLGIDQRRKDTVMSESVLGLRVLQ